MEPRRNRVKQVIARGDIALGTMTGTFSGPTVPELIGLAGFDAAIIDLEHHGHDLAQVQVLILACETADITPLVRLPSLERALITRLLDIGAQGIQLSGVESGDEAAELVDAVRFPPRGSRGLIGNSRSMRFGGVAGEEALRAADAEILVKVGIESRSGLEAVEEIAAVDGVDLVGVGPHDISAALGVVGQPDSPVMREAMERVAAACRATGERKLSLPTGHPAFPLEPHELDAMSVSFVPCQPFPERRLLESYQRQVREFREGREGRERASSGTGGPDSEGG